MLKMTAVTDFLRLLTGPKRAEINEFLVWARENAVVIEDLEDATADIERLSLRDCLLEDKRIVYLGEEDHWIHEKSDYRLLLLRYLISRGWTHIGEELGWSDGIRIDRYLETGDETYLERIATYGYRGALRTDRDDRPTGIMKAPDNNYPVAEFKSEQLRLTRSLRKLSEEQKSSFGRLRFFGFDIDTLTGGGYEDIDQLLSPFQHEPGISDIFSSLNRVEGETLEAEINRLATASDKVKSLTSTLSPLLGIQELNMLQEHIQTLYDSLRFNQVINPALDYAAVGEAMAARETVMQRHVRLILSQMKPSDKLVLMGHNRHLSKESGLFRNAGAASPGGYRGPSLGTYINHLLPGQVFSIWELHEQGIGSQPYTGLKKEYRSIPGTLNVILSKVAQNYLLPTAGSRLLEKEMDIAGLYNAVFRTSIARQADAVFFIRKVSPLRLQR